MPGRALGPSAQPVDNSRVASHRREIAGCLIGGIAETQEALDFCGQHKLTDDVEPIAMPDINAAFKKGDVRFRLLVDIANTLEPA